MKRFVLLVGCLAVLGIGMGAASALGGNASGVTTIHLVEKDLAFHFVDTPPLVPERNGPPSLGDRFVFASELLTRAGKHAGVLRATCTVTGGGRTTVNTCYGTFGLKGGQLVGITTIVGELGKSRIAIVGGTGAYAGARGEVISVSRGENSRYTDDTIRLLRP